MAARDWRHQSQAGGLFHFEACVTMNRFAIFAFVFFGCLLAIDCSVAVGKSTTAFQVSVTSAKQAGVPATVLMSDEVLVKTKTRIERGDPQLKPALDKLIKEADAALRDGPYSVTDKQKVAPSGDKHDYASYGRYWWPDSSKPNGLPYIRRDGKTNPDSQRDSHSDRSRLESLGIHTETLGLAYYFTGEEKYAIKAAELLRVWFLNPATKMNPNLNFAQGRPGRSDGSAFGVLDGRMMTRALEGSLLIAGSAAFSDAERVALKTWVAEYLNWLTTSPLGTSAAAAKNNHGTFYDAQAMYFALYCGNKAVAQKIAQQAISKRVVAQIKPDGMMPEEMARTRPLFYSNYNLHAMFVLAYLAEKVDVDIWHANQSRLRAGLDFLAPYADSGKHWPTKTTSKADRMKMFPILLMAGEAYPDGDYQQFLEKLPVSKRKVRRENLAWPLMR